MLLINLVLSMSKIELVELEEFRCGAGRVYSVAVDDTEETLYDRFLEENKQEYKEELVEIMTKLNTMSGKTGFTDTFFKLNEGKPGDGICAITDWKGKLRLYCIRFGNILLVLGGGGPKTTRTYQEAPKLLSENLLLRSVSDVMAEAIKEKDIKIEEDGSLSGNLVIEF